MKEKEKIIDGDGFLHDVKKEEGIYLHDLVPDDEGNMVDSVTGKYPTDASGNPIVSKTANQQYKDYAAKQKKAGAVAASFKDWLAKAQKDGTLKNIEEQGISLLTDAANLLKKKKGNSGSEVDPTDDLLSKIDKSSLDDKKKDTAAPAFLGVPMPVWYVGVGIVVVGGVYMAFRNTGNSSTAVAPSV